MHWRLATTKLDLAQPCLMGIVNLTPDSFSDGGLYNDPIAALARINQLIEEGAGIIDLGAESTRPGAHPVAAREQLARLTPVLDRITALPAPLSIDTSEAEVIHRVAEHPCVGAINDVRALSRPGAMEALAATRLGVCVMHMQGSPHTMQDNPAYADVIACVRAFLLARVRACEQAGIAEERICLDPGFGFGKALEHNLALFHALGDFAALGYPLLAGVSRKRMLGAIISNGVVGGSVDHSIDHTAASALASALAARRGAHILRVHDVASTSQALKLLDALV